MPVKRGGSIAVPAESALAKSQEVTNPFYYIDGITVNPWGNTNPTGTIQIKRPYTILQNATEWDCAVIRATYPMNGTPLGVCPLLGTSVTTTPFQVGIFKSGGGIDQYVNWAPENTDQPVPTTYSPQDLSSKYYWYSSVNTLLACFNTTLASIATSLGLTNPPKFSYDPASGLFSILYPTTDFGAAGTYIRMNAATAQLFSNFAGTYYTLNGQAGAFQPIVPSTTNYLVNNSINYIQLLQEAPNITSWDSMGAVTMTTDLGIVQEDVALATTTFVGSSTTQSPQITDILADSGTGSLAGGTRSGLLEYLPMGNPRWINLRTTQFTAFNIFLSWTSKSGATFPLILPPGTQATVKILFRHRSGRGEDVY